MQYFSQLGLDKEPFSNSPDPNFLHLSSQHVECLQQLEISVRLKRGLNVVIGKVGTGKTTLLRQLIRHLSADETMRVHLVLDPEFPSARAFLKLVCAQITGRRPDPALSDWGLKERIKKELFRLGVEQGRVVVLIIDEGQKITPECLEILRELLNYETNSSKLLQIVLFAQEELEPVIARMHNFVDRINCRLYLGPLSRAETRDMIDFRLDQALPPGKPLPNLFTRGALRAIHSATGGYPRKVVRLCHKAVLAMLVAGKSRINARLVRECLRQDHKGRGFPLRWIMTGGAAVVLAAVALGVAHYAPNVLRGLTPAVAAESPDGESASPLPTSGTELAEAELAEAGTAGLEIERVADESAGLAAQRSAPDGSVAIPEETRPALEIRSQAETLPNAGDQVSQGRQTPQGTQAAVAMEQAAFGPVEAISDVAKPDTGPTAAGRNPLAGLPDNLGSIRLLPLENVSEVIRDVYGVYDGWHLGLVARANKHLGDLERVPVGSRLVLPARTDLAGHIPDWAWWVSLDTARDLERAYVLVRKFRYFGLSTRILPVWTGRDGLAFRVVLAMPRADEQEARADLESLPLVLQSGAKAWRTGDGGAAVLGSMSQDDREALQVDHGETPAS